MFTGLDRVSDLVRGDNDPQVGAGYIFLAFELAGSVEWATSQSLISLKEFPERLVPDIVDIRWGGESLKQCRVIVRMNEDSLPPSA
jgi:hypothetical protein